jgi:ribonuclease HI
MITLYADDMFAINGGDHIFHLMEAMQLAINASQEWAEEAGLRLSPAKTEAIIFSRCKVTMKIAKPDIPLYIYNSPIEFKEVIKYLGIFVDQQLNWSQHIKRKVAQTKRLLGRIKSSIGKTWGPKPDLMRWAWTSCARPIFMYGSLIWGRGIKSNTPALMKLQRFAAMQLGHFKRGTPGDALDVIQHLMPLDLFIHQTVIKSYIRNRHHLEPGWSGKPRAGHTFGLIKYCQQLMDRYEIPQWTFDQIPKTLNVDQLFKVDKISFMIGQPTETDGLKVFTDGSRTDKDEIAGYGVAIQTEEEDLELGTPPSFQTHAYNAGPLATVYQAEAAAIGDACVDIMQYWKDNIPDEYLVTIHVDNQAILLALQHRYIDSLVVKDTISKLNALGSIATVNLSWIKAHNAHCGNEMADKIAKEGALLQTENVYPLLPVAKATVTRHLNMVAESFWQDRWDSNPQCRMSKMLMPKVDRKKSMNLLKYSRLDYSRIVRHITGFSFTRYHRYKVNLSSGIVSPRTCRLCQGADETSFHIILECPRLMSLRRDMLGEFILPGPNHQWSPHNFRRFISDDSIVVLEEDEDQGV